MTKVSYIHGIPASGNAAVAAQRGEVPEKRFIDYRKMTDGELRLALLAEQMNILGGYYQDPELLQAKSELERVLKTGLHGQPGFSSVGLRRITNYIGREIQKARRMTRPAAGFIVRKNISSGLGDSIIPYEDCEQYMRVVYDRFEQYDSYELEETTASLRCKRHNEWIQDINENLEPSAHHILYEYLQNPNASPAVVAAKQVSHRNAISALADITEFSRDNLRLWLRNGVMRSNAREGTQPFQPEKTIDILRTEVPASQRQERGASTPAAVSGPFLAALPIILKAVAAAVAATATLISVFEAQRQQRLRNAAQGIGSPTFGPEQGDWEIYQGGNNNGQPGGPGSPGGILQGDNLPIIAAAAGAYLLLSK